MTVRARTFVVAACSALLLLPLLFLASSAADAAPRGPACADGEIVRGVCVVDAGAPTCPNEAVEEVETCVTRTPAAFVEACPAGATGEPGACIVEVPAIGIVSCPAGAQLVGDQCESREPAPRECPDGYLADASLGGLCARVEPAEQLPPQCPVGAQGEAPDGCYILVARGPATITCPDGELEGTVCVIEGAPPTDELRCPVNGETIFEIDGLCLELFEATPCPEGTIDIGDGLCGTEVDRVPTGQSCEEGFAVVDGRCIMFGDPIIEEPQCPEFSVEDDNGDCRRAVAAAAGEYVCPDPAAALNGTSCVFTAGFVFGPCPAGEPDGAECVTVVDTIVELVCPREDVQPGPDGICVLRVATVLVPVCTDAGATLVGEVCEIRSQPSCADGADVDGRCLISTPMGKLRGKGK